MAYVVSKLTQGEPPVSAARARARRAAAFEDTSKQETIRALSDSSTKPEESRADDVSPRPRAGK